MHHAADWSPARRVWESWISREDGAGCLDPKGTRHRRQLEQVHMILTSFPPCIYQSYRHTPGTYPFSLQTFYIRKLFISLAVHILVSIRRSTYWVFSGSLNLHSSFNSSTSVSFVLISRSPVTLTLDNEMCRINAMLHSLFLNKTATYFTILIHLCPKCPIHLSHKCPIHLCHKCPSIYAINTLPISRLFLVHGHSD